MNVYHFSGNLGADPALRHTPQGKAVAQFNVGVSTGYGDKRKTVWVRCNVWEKQAELVADAFTKGSKFSGYGEITSDRWEKDGKENPQLEVRIMGFDLPPKSASASNAADGTVSEQRQDAPSNEQKPSGFDDFPDDDINF